MKTTRLPYRADMPPCSSGLWHFTLRPFRLSEETVAILPKCTKLVALYHELLTTQRPIDFIFYEP